MMDRAQRRPGWVVVVTLRKRFVAVSAMALLVSAEYVLVVMTWLLTSVPSWNRAPGTWILFMFGTALGIPLAISLVSSLIDGAISRARGFEVRGFLFTATTLTVDSRVSPSRGIEPSVLRMADVARVALYTVILLVALVVMDAQLGENGSGEFRAYWVSLVAAGWSAMALPTGVVSLLRTYANAALTRDAVARRYWSIALVLGVLCIAWFVANAWGPGALSIGGAGLAPFGLPVVLGLLLGATAAASAALAQRAIPRNLRDVAVEAVALDGSVQASEALAQHQTPGYLVLGQAGELVGWLSRADALGSPGSRLSELTKPLLSQAPLDAEQHAIELERVLDPHIDGGKIVAISHEGTAVGYIAVAEAFRHVTGDSAWSRLASPSGAREA